MIFLFPRWDMLIPWRVTPVGERPSNRVWGSKLTSKDSKVVKGMTSRQRDIQTTEKVFCKRRAISPEGKKSMFGEILFNDFVLW